MYQTKRTEHCCISTEHFFKFPHVQVLLKIQSCVIPGSLIFYKGDLVPNQNKFVFDHLWREDLDETKYSQGVGELGTEFDTEETSSVDTAVKLYGSFDPLKLHTAVRHAQNEPTRQHQVDGLTRGAKSG